MRLMGLVLVSCVFLATTDAQAGPFAASAVLAATDDGMRPKLLLPPREANIVTTSDSAEPADSPIPAATALMPPSTETDAAAATTEAADASTETDALLSSATATIVTTTVPAALPDAGNDSDNWQFNYGAPDAGLLTRPKADSEVSAATASNLVSNVFYAASVREALSEIAQQTGKIITVDDSVKGMVTCDFQDVPLEDALRIVLSVGNFVFKQMDGYILVGSADPKSPGFSNLAETRIIRLNYVTPSKAAALLPKHMAEFVTFSDESQQVCITAPQPHLDRVADFLLKMDEEPEQVVLEAKIVALESSNLLNMGLQWDWPQAQFGGFTNNDLFSSWPWGVQIGYTPGKEFTNALLVKLNLLSQTDQAVVLANPQVTALEGKPARVSVIREEYFEILTQGFYTNSELEKIEAGTILEITPRTSEAGEILLDMNLEVSDVIARGANNLPVVTRRTAKSVVVVDDGGTAVVAGLVDNRTRLGRERVPGLGYVPLLGSLFQNKVDQTTKRQVAIFVTPRKISTMTAEAAKAEMPAPIPPAGKEFHTEILDILKNEKSRKQK